MAVKTSFALVVPMLALIAGCGRKTEPPPPPPPNPPDGDAPANGGGEVTTLSGETGRIRVTLDADGNVLLVEGRLSPPEGSPVGAPVGDWEPSLTAVAGSPASLGDQIATIELFSLNDDTSDLLGAGGEDLHSHGGLTHSTGTNHCHVWVGSGASRRLVHC